MSLIPIASTNPIISQRLQQRIQQQHKIQNILQQQKLLAYNQILFSQNQIQRQRRSQFRNFVQQKMMQQSIITSKQRQLINQQHLNRMEKLKRQRQLLEMQSCINKQNLQANYNSITRINQDQQYKSFKLNSNKDLYKSQYLSGTFGKNSINNRQIINKNIKSYLPQQGKAYIKPNNLKKKQKNLNNSDLILLQQNSRWKGKFQEVQSFQVTNNKDDNIQKNNFNLSLNNRPNFNVKGLQAKKYSTSIVVDTPREKLSALGTYKTPRTISQNQNNAESYTHRQQINTNSELKPQVPFNQQLASNICKKWMDMQISTRKSQKNTQEQIRKRYQDQYKQKLKEVQCEKQIKDEIYHNKLQSKYDRQLIVHKQFRNRFNDIQYHTSPKFQAYTPFRQNSCSKDTKRKQVIMEALQKQQIQKSKQKSNRKSVSFNTTQNIYQNSFMKTSSSRKRKNKSKSNYMSPTITSLNKNRSKFDNLSKSPSNSKSLKSDRSNKSNSIKKKNSKTQQKKQIMPLKINQKKKKTNKNKDKNINLNKSFAPSIKNAIPIFRNKTPTAKSTRKNFFAPYFLNNDNKSPIKTAKCNFDYQSYRQLGNKRINNRLILSQVVYEDSKFRNEKHQMDHLFNVYQNEQKIRKDVRIKIGMAPQIMKKHKFVC